MAELPGVMVYVEWDDPYEHPAGWHDEDELDVKQSTKCWSVGMIRAETPELLQLVACGNEEGQRGRVMTIIKVLITTVVPLGPAL